MPGCAQRDRVIVSVANANANANANAIFSYLDGRRVFYDGNAPWL